MAGLQGELAHRYSTTGVQVHGVNVLNGPPRLLKQVVDVYARLLFGGHDEHNLTPELTPRAKGVGSTPKALLVSQTPKGTGRATFPSGESERLAAFTPVAELRGP